MVTSSAEFAKLSLKLFHETILENTNYVELIKSKAYTLRTYYMGVVDEHNKVNFYDGKIRVVDPNGNEFTKFEVKDYLEHIAERVGPWSYVKFPYLRKVGWKGFVDGQQSGIYRVGPLGRLNAANGMATPLA